MVPILPTRHRQRGAVGLVAALFLILVVLIMGQVTLRLAATGANDSLLTHDGVAALLLAESGLERAAGLLSVDSAACGSALAGTWGYAGGEVTIEDLGGGFVTDFDGSALAAGRCRVRATGTAGLFDAQRTVEAIIGTDAGNLLGTNADFNDRYCGFPICPPRGWLPLFGWWSFDGVDGTPAAEITKVNGSAATPVSVTASGFTAFTVTAPTSLVVSFDYGTIAPSNPNHGIQVEFELSHTGTTGFPYSGTRTYADTTGGFVSDAITIDITGTGPVTIDGFRFTLSAGTGPARTLWLDNLVMTGAGGGGAGIARWREIIN